VLLFVACATSTYPMPAGPPHTGQLNPASIGRTIPAVVLYLQPMPGDEIEILGADAIGMTEGATVRLFLSRAVIQADGSRLIGEALEDLVGARVAAVSASDGPENAVGIVAQLTPERAGRFEITSIRLRYRLNGGGAQVRDGIDTVLTVCAADPAPTECEE
jgi:hypothetical protein